MKKYCANVRVILKTDFNERRKQASNTLAVPVTSYGYNILSGF